MAMLKTEHELVNDQSKAIRKRIRVIKNLD